MNTPQLLSTKQVAEMVGRNEATIQRWAAAGKLEPLHKGEGLRGAYLFRKNDVARYLEERRRHRRTRLTGK